MAKRIQDPLETIQRSQAAAFLNNAINERVAAKEEAIIIRLVREYRGGTLTNDAMRGAIGEIFALRGLLSDIQQDMKIGFEEAEKQLSPSPQ